MNTNQRKDPPASSENLQGRTEGASESSLEHRAFIYTTEECFEELRQLLSSLEKLRWERALGDPLLIYDSKQIGGIFKNRLLVKITPSSLKLLAPTAYCIPYRGCKEMLLVESRDPEFLKDLFEATAKEIPAKRKIPEDR